MKLNELPQEIQDKLIADREEWKGKLASGAYYVTAYNKNGTRFFSATRRCVGWQDTKSGNSMPFGGGTYWVIRYGAIQWQHKVRRDPFGQVYDEYSWVRSKIFSKTTNPETGEVIDIPSELGTKKDVVALLAKLGFMGFTDLNAVDSIPAPKTIEVYKN